MARRTRPTPPVCPTIAGWSVLNRALVYPTIAGWSVLKTEFTVRFVAPSATKGCRVVAHQVAAAMIDEDCDVYVERVGVNGRAAIVFEACHRASELDVAIAQFETAMR